MFILQDFPIDTGWDELLEVDDPVSIEVTLSNNILPVNVIPLQQFGRGHLLKLLNVQSTILVFVKSYEFPLKRFELILSCGQTWY